MPPVLGRADSAELEMELFSQLSIEPLVFFRSTRRRKRAEES